MINDSRRFCWRFESFPFNALWRHKLRWRHIHSELIRASEESTFHWYIDCKENLVSYVRAKNFLLALVQPSQVGLRPRYSAAQRTLLAASPRANQVSTGRCRVQVLQQDSFSVPIRRFAVLQICSREWRFKDATEVDRVEQTDCAPVLCFNGRRSRFRRRWTTPLEQSADKRHLS